METFTGFFKDAEAAFNFFMILINRAPWGVWAVVAGLLIAWAVGDACKRWLPKVLNRDFDLTIAENIQKAKVYSDRREFLIESMAFLGGFFGTWLPYQTRAGVLLGILVGFMAPNVYTGLSVILRPVWAWWKKKWGAVGS